ncbi:type 4b pilus protein PilO2 [Paraburkholderia megapolitana]|uniref:Pilin accessory protein (PilO) n=1 Tax=Paraburkholderia megapolitana TaxID=420953 RepID=A0A1I3DVX1_9BURK|nr:type 4b pilus protein PilO2 [Paraburkholderia megapolitana]QDQ79787.1 pilO family protein [Paraburkholderia megapolitana]SFH90709.1 Pilin accessory protein (PilO) [Paraburkholderia megapolitana]
MATQIIQIDRYRFVCGLFWQSLSRRHELRTEAIELATRLNFDAMVLRIDRSFAGAGFASTREGAQFGLPSLGAMVSKAIATEGAFYEGRQQPAPNWLGAFSLPDGRWAYFAVRDGAFLPNGDWIGTSDEVFERLHGDYSLGGWNVVIGDPSIESQGFHNFYPRRIEDMIPRRGGKPRLPGWLNLVPVSHKVQRRRLALVAGTGVLIIGLLYAGLLYRAYRQNIERERAFDFARQQLLLHPSTALSKPPPVHPWASAPLPSTFTRYCLDHFEMVGPGGWQLDNYTCNSGSVSYSWSRSDSNVAILLAAEPRAVTDVNGDHASLVTPFSLPAAGDESIVGVHGVRVRLLSAFQLLGVPLRFALQRPMANGQVAADVPPWQAWRFSAQLGELSPRNVMSYLDEPGVRLDTLSYRPGQWTVEGVVYEQ